MAARDLPLRAASAVVLLPGVVGVVLWQQRWAFGLLGLTAGVVALWEYTQLGLRTRPLRERLVVVLAGAGLSSVIYLRPDLAYPATAAAVVAVAFAQLGSTDDIAGAGARLGVAVAGVFYVGSLIVALPLLQRDVPHGPRWVLLAMGVTFSNDTGAYFIGRAFGKHKLAPAISPAKTIEGWVGGLVAALLLVGIARATFLAQLTLRDCVLVAVAASVLGPAGDLVESLLKRSAGVKDSGHLIPGHGGMLDRIDALLFVGAYVYLHARYWH